MVHDVRGVLPTDVAAALTKGLPGEKTYEFVVDGAAASFAVLMRSEEGHAAIEYRGAEIRLRDAGFFEDGINVTHDPRGEVLAKVVGGNLADFGRPRGVTRLAFDAEDAGGHMWAKAGGVPTGSWLGLREHVEGRADRVCRIRRDITDEELRHVHELAAKGQDEPKIIWALAALPQMVRSFSDRGVVGPSRMPLGRELLAGAAWRGAVDLTDPVSEAAFERWRARRRTDGRPGDGRPRTAAVDPLAIGGALAMRGVGFSDAAIARTFGTMPPIDHDRETIVAMVKGSVEPSGVAA